MLYDLFSWAINLRNVNEFTDVIVSCSDIDDSLIDADKAHRRLIANLRAASFSSDLANHSLLHAKHDLDVNTHFLNFLALSKQSAAESGACRASCLVLDYLLVVDKGAPFFKVRDEKIVELFRYLLIKDKPQALALYQLHYPRMTQRVHTLFAVEKTKALLLELQDKLHDQSSSLGIASLFKTFVDDTEKFAAAILWLLKQGATPDAILTTGLLHHFFLYDVAYLDDAEGQVKSLLAILSSFAMAEDLVQAIKNTGCGSRGFTSYSLSGEQSVTELNVVAVTLPACQFLATDRNFVGLYALFGAPFLLEALHWLAINPGSVWQINLKSVLNNQLSKATLSRLINEAAKQKQPRILALLAALIDTQTAESMLNNRHSSIIHLLEHMPALRQKISSINLHDYLLSLTDLSNNSFDLILQISTLITTFRIKNKPLADVAYAALLDVMVQNPHVLDDDFIEFLIHYPGNDAIVERKFQALMVQFETCLAQQTAVSLFDISHFHTIEDVWMALSSHWFSLQLIAPSTLSIPLDKYKLYCRVVTELIAKQSITVDCKKLGELFGIEPQLQTDSISSYERFLIELLINLDNSQVLHAVIGELKQKYGIQQAWIRQHYGDSSLFQRALDTANIGLLTWLVSEAPQHLSDSDIHSAIHDAYQKRHWSVVDFFIKNKPSGFNKNTAKKILLTAAKEGALMSVQGLVALNIVSEKGIQSAMKQAIECARPEVIQHFLNINTTTSRCRIIAKGFKKAVESEDFNTAQMLSAWGENGEIKNISTSLLLQAVRHNQLARIKLLCGLNYNAPSQGTIEQAFEEAAKAGLSASVAYFCRLNSTHYPRIASVERALVAAAAKGHRPIIGFLCDLSILPPRLPAIGKAVINAAYQGHAEVVAYFCNIKSVSITVKDVDLSLQKAAAGGHLAIVQGLCSYKVKPSAKGLHYARKKAKAGQFDFIEAYLKNPHPLPTDASVSDNHPTLRRTMSASTLPSLRFFSVKKAKPPMLSSSMDIKLIADFSNK